MKKLINELDKILDNVLKQNKNIPHDFYFYCSSFYECDLKTYKGINIFYNPLIPYKVIYFTDNIIL